MHTSLSRVTVVVQHTRTRLFLGKAGGWVKNAAEARDFRRAADAITYCTRERFANVRVALFSDNGLETVQFCPESSRQEIAKARYLRRKSRALREKQQLFKLEFRP